MEKLFQKALFCLVIANFIFIPLYPKFPLLNIKETFVAIRIEDLLIGLTLGLGGCYLLISRKWKELINDTLFQIILVFFAITFISLFSGIFLTHTVISWKLGLLHFMRRIELMLLLPIVYFALNSKKKILMILSLLSVVIFLVNLYALGQQYLDWPVISTTNSEFSKGLILRLTPEARVNSSFAGHYDLAVFLAMALVLFSSLFFAFGKKIKTWISMVGLLSLGVLILTAARVSFVACAIGIFLSLIFNKKKKLMGLFLIILLFVLIYPSKLRDRLVSTVTVNILHLGQRYTAQTSDQRLRSMVNIPTLAVKTSSNSASSSTFASPSGQQASDISPGEPIDTTQLGVYRSFSIRLNLEWPRAILGFLKNPLLGTGYSSLIITTTKDRYDAIATDNDFLRSLGEVGILGTFAFGLIIIELLKRLKKGFKSSDKLIKYMSTGLFVVILSFLMNATFIDVFEASKVASLFWMMMGLGLATLSLKND